MYTISIFYRAVINYYKVIMTALFLFLFYGFLYNYIKIEIPEQKYNSSIELTSLSKSDYKIRKSSVKIITPSGNSGSGTYVNINDLDIVLTAKHVAEKDGKYTIKYGSEEVSGVVIYRHNNHDLAAILIDKMEMAKPIPFRPVDGVASIGTDIIYSGYPSEHGLLTIRGSIIGHALHGDFGRSIIVHAFGWLGCSGSGIYDNRGRLIGILWGVDMQQSPFGLEIIEDVLWIAPASEISVDEIMINSCTINLYSEECIKYYKKKENTIEY